MENFRTLGIFKAGRPRAEVCQKTADPQVTMLWIKVVEIAKSINDLMTSRSITRKNCPDFDMLDATIASALKKILNTQVHFRKKVSLEDPRAPQQDRFLPERQIAYMIYEYFRATGAYAAVQGLADWAQDFDMDITETDQAPGNRMPSTSKMEVDTHLGDKEVNKAETHRCGYKGC